MGQAKGTPKKGGISYWGFFVCCFYQLASLRVNSNRNREVNSIPTGSSSPFKVLSEAHGKYAEKDFHLLQGSEFLTPGFMILTAPSDLHTTSQKCGKNSLLFFLLSARSLSPPPSFLSSLSPDFPRFIQGPGLMCRQRHHLRLSWGPLHPEPLPVIPGRRQGKVELGERGSGAPSIRSPSGEGSRQSQLLW